MRMRWVVGRLAGRTARVALSILAGGIVYVSGVSSGVAGIAPAAYAVASAVSTPVVSLTSSSAGASEITYTITFAVSSSGLLAAGTGTVALVGPSGTRWPALSSNYTVSDEQTGGSGPASQVGIGDNGRVADITVPIGIRSTDTVNVKVTGVSNPAAPGSSYTIGVQTSSDPQLVQSKPYTITTPGQVSSPTVSLSAYGADATGVAYTFNFTLSASGALAGESGTITLKAPQGTQWGTSCGSSGSGSGSDYSISDKTNPAEGGLPVACNIAGSSATLTVPNTLHSGDNVMIIATGVTNPPAGSQDVILVSTSSDGGKVSTNPYSIGPFSAVSGLSASPSTSSAGAHDVTYTVNFSTASGEELVANQGTVSLSFPGSWWPSRTATNAVIIADTTTGATNSQAVTSNATGPQDGESGGMMLTVPFTIPGGNSVKVTVNGMVNPPSSGTVDFSVATSSQQAWASVPVSITAPSAVTGVSTSATSFNGTPVTNVNFTTSATGELMPGFSTITLVATGPLPDLSLLGSATLCVTDTATDIIYAFQLTSGNSAFYGANPTVVTLSLGNEQGTPDTSSSASFCTTTGTPPATSLPILPSAGVLVSIEASQSSTGASLSGVAFSVETSSDTVQASGLKPPAPSSSAPSITLDPTAAAGGFSTYTFSFAAANEIPAGSAVELAFPQGTVVTGCNSLQRPEISSYCPANSFSIVDGTTSSGSSSGTATAIQANDTVEVINVPNTIFAGDQISISVGSIQNPPAGSSYSVGIAFPPASANSTSAVPMESTQEYAVAPATSVTSPQVSLSSTAANATGVTYTMTFSVSSQGRLLGASNQMAQPSVLSVTAPPGTVWPTNQQDYTIVDNSASSPQVNPLGGLGISVSTIGSGRSVGQLVLPRLVHDGDSLTVTVAGVTNPPAGTNTLSLSTSSDTVPVTSATYTTTQPKSVTISSVDASSNVAGASGVTYTVNMAVSNSGALVGGQGNIHLLMGDGTVLPSHAASYTMTDNTTPSGSGASQSVDAFGSSALITVSNTISGSDSISLQISGATNPLTAGASTVTVWTSSDSVPATYDSFVLTQPASPVGANLYMTSSSPSQSSVNYTVDFNTSSTGSLGVNSQSASTLGSSITIIAPPFTNFSSATYTLEDDTTGTSLGPASRVVLSGELSMVTLYLSAPTGPGNTVTIQISNVTNAPTMGNLTAATSSDATAVTLGEPALGLPTVTGVKPNSGSSLGGANITLTGTNFELATGVSIGGTPADFTIASSTSLEIVAPPGTPGTVNVIVSNPIGQSISSASSLFTYVTGSKPTPPATYVPVSPARLADTRCTSQPQPSFCAAEHLPSPNASLSTIPSQSSISVAVTGVDGVPPADTTAVALNVTLVNPAARSGYLSVYPGSSSTTAPTVSNINWGNAGADIPNLVMVGVQQIGSSQYGYVSIYNGSSGTANVTVDIEGYFTTSTSTSGSVPSGSYYNAVSPVRLADTRCGGILKPSFCTSTYLPSQNSSLTTLGPLGQENVSVGGVDGIPLTASAAVLNVTVANADSSGFLTVWPAGGTRAVASNLNWVAGKDVANRVMVPLGKNGDVSVYNGAAGGSVNFIVDVSGYYASAPATEFSSVSPMRLCDTRTESSTHYTTECTNEGGVPPGGLLDVQVAGIDGIPLSGVAAVVANVTSVGSTSNGGYLSVLPGGTTVQAGKPPSISDVNWGASGQNVANLVVVKLGSNGDILVYNSSGKTNVIVDVMGWYAIPSSSG
ncbi:MAG: IPT/TIG domain-containing protein [Actinobacteria bacterium]|nr:IPT/TIG domain-containing protein [Actinomycetota bacterium]